MAHKSRTKSPQNTKIVKKVAHPTGNNVQQVQGEKVTMPINAETESVSPMNFKLCRQLEHALSSCAMAL